jgi:hypothetical protein
MELSQAAKALNLPRPTLSRWLHDPRSAPKLEGVKRGILWFIPVHVVDGILDGSIVISFVPEVEDTWKLSST